LCLGDDYAFVGAPEDDGFVLDSGRVYVYRRSGDIWTRVQRLMAADASRAGSQFGSSLSMDGGWLAVGAQGSGDHGAYSGSVHVFQLDAGRWTEQQKLLASDAAEGDRFGYSVAVSGKYLVVGAPYEDAKGVNSGSAYVFCLDRGTWTECRKLIPSDGMQDHNFGESVSISGDTIVVGAPRAAPDARLTGSAYLFRYGSSDWQEIGKLTLSDNCSGDGYGAAVSIWDGRALIAAVREYPTGSAYLFETRSEPGMTYWLIILLASGLAAAAIVRRRRCAG
jgi:hypothetical protein